MENLEAHAMARWASVVIGAERIVMSSNEGRALSDSTLQACIFCRIARGEIPATRVLDEEDVVAFRDLNPQAPQHILLIPRRHIESIDRLSDDDAALVGKLFLAARDLARREGLSESGYRIVTNVGEDGGQSVAHLHLHLLGGRQMGWPPG